MVGLFVAFLFHLGKTQMEQVASPPVKADKDAQPTGKPSQERPEGRGFPQFGFYAVLQMK